MRIAYLTNILTDTTSSGGSVHVTQVAKRLIERGHILYTNLQNESDNFVKFTVKDFLKKGKEMDLFYVRIQGYAGNDELTLLRKSNPFVPCLWEINAPIEELRTFGTSEGKIQKFNIHRKKLARMVDAAICVSHEMEEYARDDLGIKTTFIVHNGSDPELFTPQKRDESTYDRTKYKVLWAGSSQYRWQGIKIVQELANKLKDKGIDNILVIVTAEGESSENIFYLGHVPYSEMPRYIASADVGLCIYENIDFYKRFYFSPLKLYDYMATGLPVIGSNIGQIRLVIENNQNGLLTDNSIEDLIEKIVFLKNNPNIASEMGLRGRKAVIDQYNWDNVVQQTESIFLGAIEKYKALLSTQPKWKLAAMAHYNSKIAIPLKSYFNLSRHVLSKVKKLLNRYSKLPV